MTVHDAAGHGRMVEPHAIFLSTTDRDSLHCYQLSGHSASGRLGWKNIHLEDIAAVDPTEYRFTPRPDYNPKNTRIFKRIDLSV